MGSSTTVEAARHALGPVGAYLPIQGGSAPSADLQRDAARRLERIGYRAAWTNEVVGGKDALVQLATLLAVTEQMVFGTSIANIWARSPQTAHGGAAFLAEAHPGRFVLGLGVGYPHQAASVGREFGRPLATMSEYFGRMAAPTPLPVPDVVYPRIMAANGPKMLGLAGEIADGAMTAPAVVPGTYGGPEVKPEFTARAREILGPDKLLIVLVYASAREGDAAAIAATVREHVAAGADHVMVSQPIGTNFIAGLDRLEYLAPALTEIT